MELVRSFAPPTFPHLRSATHLVHADLLLIYGNSIIPDELANTALALWHQGFAKHIGITGGAQAEFDHFHESSYIRRCLLKGGVPDEAMTCDGKSTNTRENIIFLQQQLQEEGRFEGIDSIIGIGHGIAGTRFLMTLAANWEKDVLPMHVPVMPRNLTIMQALEDPAFYERAIVEAAKLPEYLARGHIAPVNLAGINAQVLERIAENAAYLEACDRTGKALTPQERQQLTTHRLLYAQSPQPHAHLRSIRAP